MRTLALSVSVLLLVILCPGIVLAWLRAAYEDATVVERSELIVVARLKEGSIRHVPHRNPPGEGQSSEHHATLVITQVLKGKCDAQEIPVIIHYGLTPVVRAGRSNPPKNVIGILDTGNS